MKQIETFRNVAICFVTCQNSFMDKNAAQKIALQIASDLEGPLGRIPFERVVEKHIVFFSELRSAGASWPQIADLLTGAGITRKDGKSMAASQLRASVSRIMISGPKENVSKQSMARTLQKPPANAPAKTNRKPRRPNSNLEPVSRDKQNIRQKMHRASQARKIVET